VICAVDSGVCGTASATTVIGIVCRGPTPPRRPLSALTLAIDRVCARNALGERRSLADNRSCRATNKINRRKIVGRTAELCC